MSAPITSFRGDFDFLSNFYPCAIQYDGENYPSVEHAYQAAKTLDPEFQMMIRRAVKPGYAKRIGQRVPVRPHWQEIRLEVMRSLVWKKFQIPHLGERLIATGDRLLIESNTWGDFFFWGVCQGAGENHLGLILMNIRDRLMERGAFPIPLPAQEIQANLRN